MEKILASVSLLLNWCAFYREWFKYCTLTLILMQVSMSSVLQQIRILFFFGIYDNDNNLLLYPSFLL